MTQTEVKPGLLNVKCSPTTGAVLWYGDPFDGTVPMGKMPQLDALPEGKGPSSEDMAAAGEMNAEERQQMIEGMVAQLSDRLATEGGTVEEWNRLIRSLAVLKRLPEAQKIYDEARTKFDGQAAELSFLKQAAVESGLTP